MGDLQPHHLRSACGWRPARHGGSQTASPTSPPTKSVGCSSRVVFASGSEDRVEDLEVGTRRSVRVRARRPTTGGRCEPCPGQGLASRRTRARTSRHRLARPSRVPRMARSGRRRARTGGRHAPGDVGRDRSTRVLHGAGREPLDEAPLQEQEDEDWIGAAVTTVPAIVSPQLTVFRRASNESPTGSVRICSELVTTSGHRKSFQAPMKVKIDQRRDARRRQRENDGAQDPPLRRPIHAR